MLAPGLPRLRLWSDAASRLFGVEHEDAGSARKHLLDQLDPSQLETGVVPFSAAYILSPVRELPEGAAATRERLDSVQSTVSLVGHAKLGPVLAGSESPTMLAMAADIAREVPVYALYVVRDMDRLAEVASLVAGWHSAARR